ncbi:energy transducer TonB [Persephonella sp.]
MIKIERINKYFLIGLLISIFLHVSVFALLISLERKSNEKEEKPIYVYLSEFKEEKKKAPQSKRKIPKKSEKPKPKPKPKVKKKIVKKPVKKPEKKVVKKKIQKEVIKPVKEPEKIVTETPKKIEKKALPDIVYQEEELIDELDQIVFDEEIPDISPKEEILDLSKLEGKEDIFQPGKEEKVEEEVSDADILAYIKELEMYLNNLARKRDLYPPLAKRLRIEGSLIIRFKILSDGSVDDDSIKIISSSGYNVLDKGARKLIEKYVPEFARKYGKKPPKGDLIIELPVTFEIIGW